MIDFLLGSLGTFILGVLTGVTLDDRDIWGEWRTAVWVLFILVAIGAVSLRLIWIADLPIEGVGAC